MFLNSKGGLTFRAMGLNFQVKTRLSLPGSAAFMDSSQGARRVSGDSVTWDTPEVAVVRTLSGTPTHLEISDKFVNRTTHVVGVMVQNTVSTSTTPQQVFVGGAAATASKEIYNQGNPSVFSNYGSAGLGVVEVSDLMEAQGLFGSFPDGMRFYDNNLGIPQGGSCTLEWSIYPTPSGDYWDFVNAVRKDWNCNYTIKGPFAFEPGNWEQTEKTNPQDQSSYGKWTGDRGLYYVASISTHYDDGTYADGTGLIGAAKGLAANASWMGKAQAANPAVRPLYYFHAQICTEAGADTKYADCKEFNQNGTEMVYPYNKQRLPMYMPTSSDSYGAALLGTVQQLLSNPGIGGLYWDEMAYSLAPFAYTQVWDDATVDIDPNTHEVTKQKVCVPYAMQGFQVQAVNAITGAGKELVANTEPFTRTMRDLHITRFVEGKIGHNSATNLGCPIVLANMRVETTPAMAIADAVSLLNQGCLFYAQHENWTPLATDFYQLMFPITPVDIRPGVITGSERILASKSGVYGFSDGSPAKVFIFDNTANVRSDIKVSPSSTGSATLYQISIPTGGMAILIKQ